MRKPTERSWGDLWMSSYSQQNDMGSLPGESMTATNWLCRGIGKDEWVSRVNNDNMLLVSNHIPFQSNNTGDIFIPIQTG